MATTTGRWETRLTLPLGESINVNAAKHAGQRQLVEQRRQHQRHVARGFSSVWVNQERDPHWRSIAAQRAEQPGDRRHLNLNARCVVEAGDVQRQLGNDDRRYN